MLATPLPGDFSSLSRCQEAGDRHDLVVHVVVRDTQHLKDLALDQFTNRPGVTRIETSIIFDARQRHELPVFRDLK